jgi:3-hydroxyisobutyrate dehydrogenase
VIAVPTQDHTMKIGVVGLGKMGTAISERLSEQGHQVEVWNRSGVNVEWAEKTLITAHETLAGVAQFAEVVVLSLSDDQAVRSVLNTLLVTDLTGKLIVDCSTVNPEVLASFVAQFEAVQAQLLDAPISGWPMMVRQGKAGIYIGGQTKDVARFMQVAEACQTGYITLAHWVTGWQPRLSIT